MGGSFFAVCFIGMSDAPLPFLGFVMGNTYYMIYYIIDDEKKAKKKCD